MIRFTRQNKNNEVNINVTPLLDVIFNLLIFFVIAAVITTRGINLDLPESDTAEKMPAKSWEIAIDENEGIIFNGMAISTERLQTILGAEKNRSGEERVETIVLKAHRHVSFERFVSIMDMVRRNGFYNLVIATNIKKRNSDVER